jgi:two-component system phosphate regulon sensor histidine kinase PhoR
LKLGPQTSQELGRVALLLGGALFIGLLIGKVAVVVSIALFVYLMITLLQLAQLERRLDAGLRKPQHEAPPGLWRAIDDHLQDAAKRHLRRQREATHNLRLFRAATAALPDAVVALDAGWQIQWANPAAKALLGLEVPRDHGQHVANLVRHPALAAAINDLARREPIEMPAPRDPNRWLSVVLVAYADDLHLLVARDATRIRQLEQMRREFVANASHELRSPLTVISGYLEALQEDPALAASWGVPMAEMRRQADRMAEIVGDLLELSRLENDAGEPPREPIDIAGLAARIREEALALGEGQAEVVLETDPTLELLGAEPEIYSAISNLVFNAMRYTPATGRVTVRWGLEQGAPTLAVSDTGIGIPAEHLPRLTERFYRVEASRVRSRGGTGLGLAIVKHVVQRHGGTLGIESRVGQGSTFTMRFPAARAGLRTRL